MTVGSTPEAAYDIDPARALPAVADRDPAAFGAELDRVWHHSWVVVGIARPPAEARP